MLNTRLRHVSECLVGVTILCGLLTAQMTVTGTIAGNVMDPSGQAVAGAKVTLASARTGESRVTTTNEVGAFTLNAVQPEPYNLRVELRGFGAFSVKHRPARAGRNPRTGEHVAVDRKSVPFFKTGKEMRERLNKADGAAPGA